MTVIEHVDELDDLLVKAKTDVRWCIRDLQSFGYDELHLEITTLGEANRILMYRKYREERMAEPRYEHEATSILRSQGVEIAYLLKKENHKSFLFRNKEAIYAYNDNLREIEVETAKVVKQNKADWEIYKLQRKEEKAKLKAFALAIPNIKKGYYEAK